MKIWSLWLNGQGLRSEAATNFVLSAADGATACNPWRKAVGMRAEAPKGAIANTTSGCDSNSRLVKCGHHYRGSGLTRDRVCGLPPTVTCGHHYRGCNPLNRWTMRYRPISFVVNKNTHQNIFIRPPLSPLSGISS